MSSKNRIKKANVWMRTSATSLGFYSYGYTIGIFNSSLSCISSILGWKSNSQLLISIMSAMVLLGGSFGSALSGCLSQYFGKRKNIITTDIVMIIGSILCSYPNTISFGIGRFLCGFASGCFSMLCSSYINEFTPSSMSASMGSLNQIFMMLGILSSNCICMTLPLTECEPDIKFKVFLIFSVPGWICLTQLLLFVFKYKLESPSWLIKNKGHQKALESASDIYEEECALSEIQRIISELDNGNGNGNDIRRSQSFVESSYKEIILCYPKVRKALRLGILIHIFQQLSGINGIMFFSTLLFQKIVGNLFMSRIFTIIGTLTRIFALLVVFPFINRINKKKLSVCGALLMSLCFFVLIFTLDYIFLSELNVVIVFIYLGIFTNTVGQVPWFYSSLIMPDKAVSLAVSMNFLTGMGVVLSFPYLLESIGIRIAFVIYCVLNGMSAIYFCFDMVDSSKMSTFQMRRSLSLMK